MTVKIPDLLSCGTCGDSRANHDWRGDITDPETVSVCSGGTDDATVVASISSTDGR